MRGTAAGFGGTAGRLLPTPIKEGVMRFGDQPPVRAALPTVTTFQHAAAAVAHVADKPLFWHPPAWIIGLLNPASAAPTFLALVATHPWILSAGPVDGMRRTSGMDVPAEGQEKTNDDGAKAHGEKGRCGIGRAA